MKYYAAYRSNLNLEQMKNRCPSATVFGFAMLPDYELSCRGVPGRAYLTVDPKTGSQVPLGIFRIEDTDEKELDLYEDYPALYDKKVMDLEVTGKDGIRQTVPVLYYIMVDGYEKNPASAEYVIDCLRGYADFDFDNRLLVKAFER